MTDAPPEAQRVFSLEEANQRLPLVKAIVRDIVDLFGDLHERRQALNDLRQERSLDDSGIDAMERGLEVDIERLENFVHELAELGVELKDPLVGLVDFQTRIDGRDAYLCWKLGEEEIAWWHDLDSGFAGRQPLLERSIPTTDDGTGIDDEESTG